MRDFAVKRGFRYLGPSAPKWFGIPVVQPSLPFQLHLSDASMLRQAWNVIEGEESGLPVLIFDTVLGQIGWYTFRTFVACETPKNPFRNNGPTETQGKSGAWHVIYRMGFLSSLVGWSMSIRRIDNHLTQICKFAAAVKRKEEANSAP